ncbi:MAG: ogr/Delta-like zinc finger family protein [Sphingomonas sp.]|uniref:ogr/Delta-like zinc finger family protein n=1 Tax=Sphingomonas sp. TaxID=28214 RepID=UPI00356B5145
MNRRRPRAAAINCPHCGGRAIIRSSIMFSPLVREMRMACDDDDCAHTFLCQISVVRTIRQSLRPNPNVSLPLGNPNVGRGSLRQPERPANDDVPSPANDDCLPIPAARDALPPPGIRPMSESG